MNHLYNLMGPSSARTVLMGLCLLQKCLMGSGLNGAFSTRILFNGPLSPTNWLMGLCLLAIARSM